MQEENQKQQNEIRDLKQSEAKFRQECENYR